MRIYRKYMILILIVGIFAGSYGLDKWFQFTTELAENLSIEPSELNAHFYQKIEKDIQDRMTTPRTFSQQCQPYAEMIGRANNFNHDAMKQMISQGQIVGNHIPCKTELQRAEDILGLQYLENAEYIKLFEISPDKLDPLVIAEIFQEGRLLMGNEKNMKQLEVFLNALLQQDDKIIQKYLLRLSAVGEIFSLMELQKMTVNSSELELEQVNKEWDKTRSLTNLFIMLNILDAQAEREAQIPSWKTRDSSQETISSTYEFRKVVTNLEWDKVDRVSCDMEYIMSIINNSGDDVSKPTEISLWSQEYFQIDLIDGQLASMVDFSRNPRTHTQAIMDTTPYRLFVENGLLDAIYRPTGVGSLWEIILMEKIKYTMYTGLAEEIDFLKKNQMWIFLGKTIVSYFPSGGNLESQGYIPSPTAFTNLLLLDESGLKARWNGPWLFEDMKEVSSEDILGSFHEVSEEAQASFDYLMDGGDLTIQDIGSLNLIISLLEKEYDFSWDLWLKA